MMKIQRQGLRPSSRHWVHGLCVLCLCMASAFGAIAATKKSPTLTYHVYAGGIHAVDATLDLQEKAGTYQIISHSATRGFLGALIPWKGTFLTEGRQKKTGSHVPSRHESISGWREETEIKTYMYDGSGQFKKLTVMEDGKDKTPKDTDWAIAKNTTDLLSATLNMMAQVTKTGDCAMTQRIFDGDRTFDLRFRTLGKEVLTASRYNPYAGAAVKCEVEVIPKEGRWHKKPRGWLSIQEQGRKHGQLPIVWLGTLPGHAMMVPVKLRITSDHGTLFMHLAAGK